jgi:hypothetical protein
MSEDEEYEEELDEEELDEEDLMEYSEEDREFILEDDDFGVDQQIYGKMSDEKSSYKSIFYF